MRSRVNLPQDMSASNDGANARKNSSSKIPAGYEPPDDDDNQPLKLKRHIGPIYGICFVVNMMVGSGIFAVPTGVLRYCNGDVIASLLVWGVGGAIALLCSLCVAELGSSIRQSGAWIGFLHYTFGDFPAFVYAWVSLTMAYPEGQAAQIAVLGEYVTKVILDDSCEIPNLESAQKCFGIAIFLVLVAINLTNIKLAIRMQAVCAFAKTAALAGIVITGVVRLIQDNSLAVSNLSIASNNQTFSLNIGASEFSMALYQCMWAYNGYEAATWVTEEVKNPRKSIPIIMYCSVPLVVALYIFVNIAFLTVLTPEEMLSSRAVAVTFGQRIHPLMAYFMMISVCLSLIGTINVALMIISRIPFASGRLGYMPEFLSMAHVKYVSPVPAVLLPAIMALLMVSSNSFEILVTAKQFTEWGFKGLAFAGILYLRKTKPDLNRPYKAFPPAVIIVVLISIYLVLAPLIFEPRILYLLSIPALLFLVFIYFLTRKGIIEMSGIGKVGIFMQKLFVVAPTSKEHLEPNSK